MIILLNGPLGIGKSTLAEAFMEAVDGCVMLDGDHVVAVNPPPEDEVAYLHETLALLVRHHRSAGYRHFVINHIWRTAAEIDDLRRSLGETADDLRCFLLVLPLEENLRRIRMRQGARALDETQFEFATVAEERALLAADDDSLGEPFDVSDAPDVLVQRLLERTGLTSA